MEQAREAKIPLDAPWLRVNPVRLVARFCELLFEGPCPRSNGGIFDADLVFERVGACAGPAFDKVQVLA